MYKKDIVYISSINWKYSWHRQQEMMLKMAENGYRVLFVEPSKSSGTGIIHQIAERIWSVQPKGVPYERCSFTLNAINEYVSRKAIINATKQLSFDETIFWIDRIHGFDFDFFSKRGKTIYDLVDETLAFGRFRNKRLLLSKENKVLNGANLLLSSSNTLMKRKVIQSGRSGFNLFIPNGVETSRFLNTSRYEPVDSYPHPIAGFVGTLSDRSVNFDLVNKVAGLCEDFSFVFVGPGSDTWKERVKSRNIFLLDAVPGEKIPAVINSFDIGIIPYNNGGSSMDYVFPRKACEYLAAGKPVVGTDLLELACLKPYVAIAHDAEEFALNLRNAQETFSVDQRKKFVKKYSWDALMIELNEAMKNL